MEFHTRETLLDQLQIGKQLGLNPLPSNFFLDLLHAPLQKTVPTQYQGTFYQSIARLKEFLTQDEDHAGLLHNEQVWTEKNKPYYNVYPSVIDCLLKVRLDAHGSSFSMPMEQLLIRFPRGHEPSGIKAIFCFKTCWKNKEEGLGAWIRQVGDPEDTFVYTWFEKDKEIEQSIAEMQHQHESEKEVIKEAVRFVFAVGLLAQDESIISPDVLSKDRHKLDNAYLTQEELQIIIDRAHRRGKVGWEIGKHIEVNPHFRRPHFAIRWKGKGRTQKEIVPVKGAFVKRSSVTKIPTGYLGLED